MGALFDAAQDPVRRRRIVDDGVAVIDAEVDDKSGVTGLAVKAGFKVVKGVKPGIIPQAMNNLLDDFARKVDPFYDEFKASGQADLRTYFVRRGNEIAEALLAITDDRAARSDHRTLKSAYQKLRPQAVKHVVAAMPRVADLVRKHAV